MRIEGAIFDADGTLLDSMACWDSLGERFLHSVGCCPNEDLSRVISNMSLAESARYFQQTYHLAMPTEEIVDAMRALMEKAYRQDVELKAGAGRLLHALWQDGIRMGVATSGDAKLVEAALRRCGVLDWFDFVMSSSADLPGKEQPDLFEAACRRLQTEKSKTMVFEDAIYAIRTAASAGFPVCAVFDASQPDWPLAKSLADFSVRDFRQITYRNGYFECSSIGTYESQEQSIKEKKRMKTALTIAGTDPTGGAGMQADLKTMTMNGVFAMSAITALVAQNTMGVREIVEMSPAFLKAQIDAVFEDIPVDAVKIGMVSSSALIATIASCLRLYQARNIVVDPVMVATSGHRLIEEEAIATLQNELLPLACVITPNLPEAEILWGQAIQSAEDMEKAARTIGEKWGCAVLVKGGHSLQDASDVLFENGKCTWFYGRHIDNPNTHGTGCTLSSAIAANLAKGFDLSDSIERAKAYLSGALAAMLDLGHGKGPMQHNFNLEGEFARKASSAKSISAKESGSQPACKREETGRRKPA